MANYKISGVWKNTDKVITHYAFHTVTNDGTTRATKKSKAVAVELLEKAGNSAITWIWNYKRGGWDNGETVEVVNGKNGNI